MTAPAELMSARRRGLILVVCLAVASAVLATRADAEPTGIALFDTIYLAVFAGLVVLAASVAPRWAVIVLAAAASAAAGLSVWAVVAWVSLCVALAGAFLARRSRVVGAVAAGLAIQALLRLPDVGFFGLASLIAGVTGIIVIVMGYRYSSRRVRARLRVLIGVVVLGAIGIGLVGGLSLLNARTDVERGVDAARRGLQAARGGDTATVVTELERAEESLRSAQQRANGRPARLLRVLPIASQHHEAIRVATEQGAIIAREAAVAVAEADLDTVTLQAGEVDLDGLAQMAPRLVSTAAALERGASSISAAQSPWLVPALRDRMDEFTDEIEALLPEARLAASAVEVVPGLLGSGEARVYFVIFGTPAESRELGGLLGSWARIEANQGRLRLLDSGRISQLYDAAAENTMVDGVVPAWFVDMARPTEFPQNLTSSPDLRTVAAASQVVLDGAFEEPIDGYVYLDAFALIDLLELTGPVTIPFQDEPLTSDNAAEFFFDGQYRLEGIGRSDIFDSLAAVGASALGRLSQTALPGPEELGRVLGPAARGGHLQVVTFDETENAFLESVKLLRRFERSDTQDFVGLVQTNGTPNKLDIYLQRDVSYEVAIGADGTAVGRLVAVLSSDLPDDAPEAALGTEDRHRVLLSLYSPLALSTVTVDGVVVDPPVAVEFGLGRYLVDVDVPLDGTPRRVEFTVVGAFDSDEPYSLEVWQQPLVNHDQMRVTFVGPDDDFEAEFDLIENMILTSNTNGQG